MDPREIVTTVGEDQRSLRTKIEVVESHTGDIGDEEVDIGEHRQDVALHGDEVFARPRCSCGVGRVDELPDPCVCGDDRRVVGGLHPRMGLVDESCVRGLEDRLGDGDAEEVERRVVVRVVLAFPRRGVHDRAIVRAR